MLLIIAHHYDYEALWLYNSVKQRLPVDLVVPEALGLDYSISLNLSDSDAAHAAITWYKTGEKTMSKDVKWVINRLSYIDPIIWNKSEEKEKQYATNEMNAFFSAFVYSFGNCVTNQVQNGCLYGVDFQQKAIAFFEKNGIQTNAALLAQISEGKIIDNPPLQPTRFVLFNGNVYEPQGQTGYNEILTLIRDSGLVIGFDMAEFVFTDGKAELLSASVVPVLSACGKPLVKAIINYYKKLAHGTYIRYSQREPGSSFGESLQTQENSALHIQSA